MSDKQKLKGRILTPLRVIENGEVCFENGKITYVGPARTDDGSHVVTDYGDKYISPGFIDIHVHGGGGHDFMDCTLEAFLGAARLHAAHGTATLLPTTLTCPDEELFMLFDLFAQAKAAENDGAFLAGLHLEGPYFAPSQKGAQDERYIVPPRREHYEKILEKANGSILRWSVAPELEGAMELGRRLMREGILPSIGHSDAVYETALEAFENGYTHLTHFYSGMSGLVRKNSYRFPGLIESGYMEDGFTVEVIADGCHLPISMLKYVYTAKGPSKTVLVTDAIRGAGQTEGHTIIGSLKNGYEVFIEDGVAKLLDRSAFAGSVATADRLVRNMYKHVCPICDAVRMMTLTPARIVGLKTKGVLAEGFDADFTVFDDDIRVEATYSNGRKIYAK